MDDRADKPAELSDQLRILVGIAAVIAFFVFILRLWSSAIATAALYSGVYLNRGRGGILEGALAQWYDKLQPFFLVVFVVGLVSTYVLAVSFVVRGKQSLHRRSHVWWLLSGLFSVLILVAMGGKYLPFIDVSSNTEALFERMEREFGAGIFLWIVVPLFYERGDALANSPDAPRSRLQRFPQLVAAVITVLVIAMVVPSANELPTGDHVQRTDMLRKLTCDSTHVVAGTARDFEVVREPHCLSYDDRRPNEGANVLGRCESLQFKVDVAEQIWPLPAARADVERVRIFRWGGVRGDIAAMRHQLSQGVRLVDGVSKAVDPGARVFHGKADVESGTVVLRNTFRGELYSERAPPKGPRYADSPVALCSERQRLAEEVRHACGWDYALIASAKWFRPVAPDGRSVNTMGPVGSLPNMPQDKRELDDVVIERGDFIEVGLDVIENLDPSKPLPRREFVMRLQSLQRAKLKVLRGLWSDAEGSTRRVLLVHEDDAEPGLLHLVTARWDDSWPASLSQSGFNSDLDNAKRRLHACEVAHAAFAGRQPPKPP